MQQEIIQIVKITYYDYEITRVHEIEIPLSLVTYVVQLAGKREIIDLRIYDGEIEVMRKFIKSK
jgi:hypothetical protein